MMQVNDLVECKISNLGHDGEGVGQIDGLTVFVPGALPEERVRVRITKVKSSYATAQLVDLIEQSVERIEPRCEIYDACGGCQLQHGKYAAQLRWKEDRVRQTLKRIGKLQDVLVHPVKGMDDPWAYRNKVQVPVGLGMKAGFYARNSHRIIPFQTCPIQQSGSAELVQRIVQYCSSVGITAYDEKSGTGWMRHVLVRIAEGTGEWMVILVTRTANWPGNRKQAFIEAIRLMEPRVISIHQNVNSNRNNVILGKETLLLWGREQITDVIPLRSGQELHLGLSPQAFYQVNTKQMQVLYEIAAGYAALTGCETLIDAYCGIGSIALYMAANASRVYGVEIVPQAIADALLNAERNGFQNVTFETGDATEWMKQWHSHGIEPDVVVLDPPRKGCDVSLLDTVHAMRPKRIVYVSCDVATFSRDAAHLQTLGWALQEVQPVDLFPQTAHIEVVGWFK